MFRIRKDTPATDWMLPEAKWYHSRVTFTNLLSEAAVLTQEECDHYLSLSGMQPGAYQEPIPE